MGVGVIKAFSIYFSETFDKNQTVKSLICFDQTTHSGTNLHLMELYDCYCFVSVTDM